MCIEALVVEHCIGQVAGAQNVLSSYNNEGWDTTLLSLALAFVVIPQPGSTWWLSIAETQFPTFLSYPAFEAPTTLPLDCAVHTQQNKYLLTMSQSALVTATLQSASLSALSNIIGQSITCYQANKPWSLNTTDLFHFTLYSILVTPLNFLWQSFLEGRFPAYTTAPAGGKSLDLKNTVAKFALDQTFGAAFNTMLFIVGIDLLRGHSIEKAKADLVNGFWPIILYNESDWFVIDAQC